MPALETFHFGSIEYTPEMVLTFPQGIPAFELETRFLALQPAGGNALVFLQSLTTPGLVFLTVPAGLLAPDYKVTLSAEERAVLSPPGEPSELLCLAIVTTWEDGNTTANLMSPLVIDKARRRGIQSIQSESGYHHEHPVCLSEVQCS